MLHPGSKVKINNWNGCHYNQKICLYVSLVFLYIICNIELTFLFLKVSGAPPPASQAQAKAKFEMGKKFVSEEQRKKEQMERMFAAAKNVEGEEVKPKALNPEDEEVAEDEWDD